MNSELIVIKKSLGDKFSVKVKALREKNMRSGIATKKPSESEKRKHLVDAEGKDTIRESNKVECFMPNYERMVEGRKVHAELLKQGVLDADFSATYFGWFTNKDAFAYFKLYGSNGISGLPGTDYRDYADEIFKNQFVFLSGHVFWK